MKIGLNPKTIGLDISDRTVEAVGLKRVKEEIKILGLSRISLPEGIIVRGRIRDKEELKKRVGEVLTRAVAAAAVQPPIIFSLPETQIFTYLFYWRKEDNNMNEAVKSSIRTTVPYPLLDLEYSYRILGSRSEKGILILISAVRKKIKREWEDFFNGLALPVVWFDLEVLANARGMFKKLPSEPTAILDIGAATSNFFIFTSYGLVYTHTISQAGDNFTNYLSKQLKIKYEEAENLKKKEGLSSSRIREVLTPAVEILIKAVKEDVDFWQRENKQKIKELVMVGGSSQMPGWLDFWRQNSEFAVRLGKPWLKEFERNLFFIESFGSALRGLRAEWEATDPGFPAKSAVKFSFMVFLYRLPIFSFYWTRRFLRFGPKINKGRKIWLAGLVGLIIFLAGIFGWLFLKPVGGIYRHPNQRPLMTGVSTSSPVKKKNEILLPETKKETLEQINKPAESAKKQKIIKIKPLSARLNVRQGPGLNFKVIGQVEPGKNYMLMEEGNEWVRIKLSADVSGWVFAKFIEK